MRTSTDVGTDVGTCERAKTAVQNPRCPTLASHLKDTVDARNGPGEVSVDRFNKALETVITGTDFVVRKSRDWDLAVLSTIGRE